MLFRSLEGRPKPPPAPPSKDAQSAVDAFGSALEAAVSRVDVAVEDAPAAPFGHAPKPDIPIFGEHTPQPSALPPSLGHLGAPDAKLELGAPIPLVRAESPAAAPRSMTGAFTMLVLATTVVGGAAAWWFLIR